MTDKNENLGIHLGDQASAMIRDVWAKVPMDGLDRIYHAMKAERLDDLPECDKAVVLATVAKALGDEHMRRYQADTTPTPEASDE